jgi:hypothetical protein
LENRLNERPSDCEFRQKWILEAAYYRAKSRCFVPGLELEDWLFAENEFVIMQIMRFQVISSEDGGMSIRGLQRLAKSLGVENAEAISQVVDLIHAIQKETRNEPCFSFDPENHCNAIEPCLWKSECKKMIAKWLPLNGLHN